MKLCTLLLGLALSMQAAAGTLSWSELNKMPLPPPGQRITYGPAPQQFGELRLPSGKGPFPAKYPVMVLIHGGCWVSDYDYVYFTRLADWLARQGVASWTIEYRRLGNDGGGWPGTFLDVGRATDALRDIAKNAPLDPGRVYAAGHSAGGQLALWLAARGKLPADSAVRVADPLRIRGVLGLGAITDLETYRIGPADSCNASVDPLLGGSDREQPARYAQASPLRLLPLGVPQVFIHGALDPIVPLSGVNHYVDTARRAGDHASELLLPQSGHFETAVPYAPTEASFREALKMLLK